jgi:hypothetical protein
MLKGRVAFALAAAVAVIAAVPAAGGASGGDTALYVVQLVQPPVAGYEGGVAGYPATKPARGKKLDATSADAKKYAGLLEDQHNRALSTVGGADKVYDYTAAFNGFAARLTEDQAAKLEAAKGVVLVEKAVTVELDTSSTPAFLGLDKPGGLWAQLGGVNKSGLGKGAGEDVVIGDVDGGYWPENNAFADRKFDGIDDGKLYPHKVTGFHGICQAGEEFPASTCNDKVLAARYFNAGIGTLPDFEFVSPRDFGGHGTHTASTMAGNNGVQATGDAAPFGKTSGIAPRARLAVYKACWVLTPGSSGSCNSADTTAAIDQAVEDGVDAINYSISGTQTAFTNSVEVSFLFAAAAGVYVSASAGNSGPTAATVAHPSPWITTTAAGTHNRDGLGKVTIDGTTYDGHSSAAAAASGTMAIYGTRLPLPQPAEAALTPDQKMRLCYPGTLPASAAGKIAVCERGVNARIDKSLAVSMAGGAGMIMINPTANSVNADLHFVPSIHLGGDTAASSTALYDTVEAAAIAGKTASLTKGTIVYNADAPFTAAFSSRGPILAGGGDILKPDIIAPGQDILASVAPPGNHDRNFDLYSGTSMSSPHMTALGALMHQAHPDWSPMMIKSALMTTAYQGHDYDAFNWGAGHVDPNKAVDPGLVFDSNLGDWLAFLKGQGLYTGPGPTMDASDLNSASIAIGDMAGSQTVLRKAMSVGSKSETYTFSYTGLAGLTVTPSATSFTAAPGSVTPWSVTFLRTSATLNAYTKGFIVWTGNQGHVVKMPVVIQPVRFAAPSEVTGSGTTGSLTYTTKAGYTGTLTYPSIRGLQAATKFDNHVNGDPACAFNTADPDSMVTAGTATVSQFTTPAGASFIRFQTFQSDATPSAKDLDMFVYRAPPGSSTYTLVLASGGPDSNEVASSTSAGSLTEGAQFKVYIHGCSVDAGGGDFTLFAWALTGSASNPFTATPVTHTVAIGQIDDTTFGWDGLPAGNRYLGRVLYGDGAVTFATPITQISVSTR